MDGEEQKKWKQRAKDAMKTPAFIAVQRAYRQFRNQHGPGLGVAIPEKTFFTENAAAGIFLRNVTKDL